MDTPSVSIVVPVHRTPEHLLERLLQSALCQTHANLQLIVVDDASGEVCARILDATAARDPRMVVLHRPTAGGVAMARNDGLAAATGDFLLFADADDVMAPAMCATLVALAQQEAADVVACSWAVHVATGARTGGVTLPRRRYDLQSPRELSRCCRSLNFALWNKLFRRQALKALRFESFEVGIGEDTLFNIAVLCQSRRAITTPYCGYAYTVHAASTTGRPVKGLPYLRALAHSTTRLRETLVTASASSDVERCADYLALKRYGTGCAWIAEERDAAARAELWTYWRAYFREQLLPSLTTLGALALGYAQVIERAGPARTARLMRLALALSDPAALFARSLARIPERPSAAG